ncbi:MAG: hypothetical protein RIB98_14860 [Acidimicrobiales bacterium]
MFGRRRLKKELAALLPGGAVTHGPAQAHCRLRDETIYLASDGGHLLVRRPDLSTELHELGALQRVSSIHPYMALYSDAINDEQPTVSCIFDWGGNTLTELIKKRGTLVDPKKRSEAQTKPRPDGNPHTIGTSPRSAPVGEAHHPDGQSLLVNASFVHDGSIILTAASSALVPLQDRPGLAIDASDVIRCRYEGASSHEWRGGLVVDFNHAELAQLRLQTSVIDMAGSSEAEIESWMSHYGVPVQTRSEAERSGGGRVAEGAAGGSGGRPSRAAIMLDPSARLPAPSTARARKTFLFGEPEPVELVLFSEHEFIELVDPRNGSSELHPVEGAEGFRISGQDLVIQFSVLPKFAVVAGVAGIDANAISAWLERLGVPKAA